MGIRSDKIDELARAAFLAKLDAAFSRDLQDYVLIDQSERHQFLYLAMAMAGARGLVTEQGIASYALALWYLGADFEEKSDELQALLAGSLPEVRKVHAMNKWVETLIGDPENTASADKVLLQALKLSAPWARSH
ncbi:hypothetical protein GPEL0_01r2749 [Geoanaerobacter pelophilus]|uniref:Uncharacterized protein n=1 Tax=Geoanaerobacter pelophilus TaxID=60036 RepID=A0ABQ0MLN3_9BACT|nr:hypothetical protein [Geoanaerobacter pelophilus]GAW67096.1 hypothetical protein GPEL0_01r2749 [Geoanaerobacter pelophilus]